MTVIDDTARWREVIGRTLVSAILIAIFIYGSYFVPMPEHGPQVVNQFHELLAVLVTLAVFTLTKFTRVFPLSPILLGITMLAAIILIVSANVSVSEFVYVTLVAGLVPAMTPDAAIVWFLKRPASQIDFERGRREQTNEQIRLLTKWRLYDKLQRFGIDGLLDRTRLF